jgi:hypothetical protein
MALSAGRPVFSSIIYLIHAVTDQNAPDMVEVTSAELTGNTITKFDSVSSVFPFDKQEC